MRSKRRRAPCSEPRATCRRSKRRASHSTRAAISIRSASFSSRCSRGSRRSRMTTPSLSWRATSRLRQSHVDGNLPRSRDSAGARTHRHAVALQGSQRSTKLRGCIFATELARMFSKSGVPGTSGVRRSMAQSEHPPRRHRDVAALAFRGPRAHGERRAWAQRAPWASTECPALGGMGLVNGAAMGTGARAADRQRGPAQRAHRHLLVGARIRHCHRRIRWHEPSPAGAHRFSTWARACSAIRRCRSRGIQSGASGGSKRCERRHRRRDGSRTNDMVVVPAPFSSSC